MDWFAPSMITALAGAIVGGIVFAIRMEGRIARQGDAIARLEKENADLHSTVNTHLLNTEIHFNKTMSGVIDNENKRRFQKLEESIETLSARLDQKFESLAKRLEGGKQ